MRRCGDEHGEVAHCKIDALALCTQQVPYRCSPFLCSLSSATNTRKRCFADPPRAALSTKSSCRALLSGLLVSYKPLARTCAKKFTPRARAAQPGRLSPAGQPHSDADACEQRSAGKPICELGWQRTLRSSYGSKNGVLELGRGTRSRSGTAGRNSDGLLLALGRGHRCTDAAIRRGRSDSAG